MSEPGWVSEERAKFAKERAGMPYEKKPCIRCTRPVDGLKDCDTAVTRFPGSCGWVPSGEDGL